MRIVADAELIPGRAICAVAHTDEREGIRIGRVAAMARGQSFSRGPICPAFERSNQLRLPQARISIPARDDMVVPSGLAASTIALRHLNGRAGGWIAVG